MVFGPLVCWFSIRFHPGCPIRPISKHGATETDTGDVADTGCIHCVSLSTSVKLSNSPSRGEEEIRKGVDLKEVEVEVSKEKNKKNSNKKPEKNWDKH